MLIVCGEHCHDGVRLIHVRANVSGEAGRLALLERTVAAFAVDDAIDATVLDEDGRGEWLTWSL